MSKLLAIRIRGNLVPVGTQWGYELTLEIGQTKPFSVSFRETPYLCVTREIAIAFMKRKSAEIAELITEKFGREPIFIADLNRCERADLSKWKEAPVEVFH